EPPRGRRACRAIRRRPPGARTQVLRRRDLRRGHRAADPHRVGRRSLEACRCARYRRRGQRRRRIGSRSERSAPAAADRLGAGVRRLAASRRGADHGLLPVEVATTFPLLTSLVVVPILGALALLMFRDDEESAPAVRKAALIVSLLVCALT